jgi:hypothetical protein
VIEDNFASQRRYPVRCPACGAGKGYPTTVQTVRARPGHIRIDLCCHGCKHEWFEEVDIDGR